jgi:SAM-dependent methyltransferase
MSIPPRILAAEVSWADTKAEELVHVPCNICGTFDCDPLASLVLNSTEFFLLRCRRCGLIWRDPLPGKTFSYQLYSERYFDVALHSPALVDQVGIADVRPDARQFRDAISDEVVRIWQSLGLSPLEETGEPRRLLEVGGGRGYLQRAADRAGWHTMGVEISPHGIKEAIKNGSLVFPIPLDELSLKYVPYQGYFDVVVFYDFLEHVDDPARVLRTIGALLKNTGSIVFRVPETVGCPRLHLIDHIWHFEPQALDMLLYKEGFTVWHAHYSGTFKAANGLSMENMTIYARKSTGADPGPHFTLAQNPLDAWLSTH